jgi:hypothetical protein
MLSRLQKYALAAFIILMAVDLVISSYGVLFFPAFTEANALFARFVEYPLQFIAVVGVTKLLVIAGIIAATIWFNRRESANSLWHGGDILCSTAAVGMGAMMLVLVVGNLLFV